MLKRAIEFIKYNNAALLILAVIFLLGTGALATETGRAALGARETSIEGVDNTLLLEADLDNFDMDYKIERIEKDDSYYYVTYTYIDLVNNNNVWQYQIQEDIRRVTLNLDEDLGQYLAEELAEEYEKRIKDLKAEQAKAEFEGESKRVEISEFSGLLGATLDLAGKVFPGYESVTVQELPSPILPPNLAFIRSGNATNTASAADNLTQVYLEYINENDPDGDNIFGSIDNCPTVYNNLQEDSDDDGVGDACENLDDPSTSLGQASNSTATSGDELIDPVDDGTATPTEEAVIEETVSEEMTPEETITEEPAVEELMSEETVTEETPAEEPNVEIIELPNE